MVQSDQPSTSLQHFFSGIAEQTFQVQLGVADPIMVDYLSDLLMRFLRTESLQRMRSPRGRPLLDLTDLLSEASQRIGVARRQIHQHIGDLTLFWTGLFPESLRDKGEDKPTDRFIEYCHQGKRAYLVASSIEIDDDVEVSSEVLERLGQQFDLCAYGLREVRREWENRGNEDDNRPLPFLIN